MSVKEYLYLTEALKDEVFILRGDLKKSGLPIHRVTDEKLLRVIPNDQLKEGVQDNSQLITVTTPTGSRGNLNFRRYESIVNLGEEDLILKYCELRAKYENLMESAGKKIYELKTNITQSGFGSWLPKIQEDQEYNEKVKKAIAEHEKKISELNEKIEKDTNDHNEKTTSLSEELNKLKEENSQLKEENEKLKSDLQTQKNENEYINADLQYLKEEHTKLGIVFHKY